MYREILTIAIIAKGEKQVLDNNSINVEKSISKVLGCWIINHNINVQIENQDIYICGSYDAYLWFGFNKNTDSDLIKTTITFKDLIPYTFSFTDEKLKDNNDVKEYIIIEPNCKSMTFKDDLINFEVERKISINELGWKNEKHQAKSLTKHYKRK